MKKLLAAFLVILLFTALPSAFGEDVPQAGYVSVLDYGATGKGLKDDTAAIQRAIDENPGHTIWFPAGRYRISEPIRLYAAESHAVNLALDPSATIFTNTEIECLLFIGDTTYGDYVRGNGQGRRYVTGGIFDGDNTEKVIWLKSRPQLMRFEDLKVINFDGYGFYAEPAQGTYSSDFELVDSWFYGKSSMSPKTCTGVYCSSGDNTFSNLRIDGCRVAMDIRSGGNFVSKVHATLMTGSLPKTPLGYNRTIGFNVATDGFNTFDQCYADTFAYGWYFAKDSLATLSQCNVYYWYQDDALNNVVISMNGGHGLTVEGCTFQMPAKGNNTVVEKRSSSSYANGVAEFTFTGNKIDGAETLAAHDLCFSSAAMKRTTSYPYTDAAMTLCKDDIWYPLGLIKAVDRAGYRMTVTNEQDIFDITVFYNKKGEADIAVLNAWNRSGADFTFALGNAYEANGAQYAYLYMKRTGEVKANLDVSITNLALPREGDFFSHSLFVKNSASVASLTPVASVSVQ